VLYLLIWIQAIRQLRDAALLVERGFADLVGGYRLSGGPACRSAVGSRLSEAVKERDASWTLTRALGRGELSAGRVCPDGTICGPISERSLHQFFLSDMQPA